MPDALAAIADAADMVVCGYAFTSQDGLVRVLRLSDPRSACVLDREGVMLETTMDDIEQEIVCNIYRQNMGFMVA